MKLGIKVAPGNAWKRNVEVTRPQMVEIWYNAGKPADYDQMFAYLSARDIDIGLHYWGAIPNNILTNISYPDPSVTKPSLELMYATIDVAAAHRCVYVNVHPDLYSLLHVNFDTMDIRVASKPANPNTAKKLFTKHITDLSRYAKSRGVILTVETVPMRDTPTWRPDRNRHEVIDTHQMQIDLLTDLARRGVAIANDTGHTACNLISNNREAIWRFLYTMTRTLAPVTRLIHLGFIVPPYNGVDFHDSLNNPVLNSDDAIPNKTEMIKLLKIFANRDDVYILVEPKTDHVKNYFLARGILESAGVLT
jgi:sugar phosphate isomerase/epimerase